jgi:hypothetical protein
MFNAADLLRLRSFSEPHFDDFIFIAFYRMHRKGFKLIKIMILLNYRILTFDANVCFALLAQ